MKICFHRSFQKRYRKIPAKIRNQFDQRLILLEAEPFNSLLNNHPLTGDRLGQWSINVTGDWRAIYELKSSDSIVFVEINTHSNLYK